MRNFFLIQPRTFLRAFYPDALWRIETTEKNIYLTFDDGPIPVVTEWVLDLLKEHNAGATFFCVGSNVKKHPAIFERILREKHAVGNHTMHHIKGFRNSVDDYMTQVEECGDLVKSRMFRPPYGQLRRGQYEVLKQNGYRVVFWDVISYDYENISGDQCLNNVLQYTREGSIVLFHDSEKAHKNLRYSLPLFMKHFANLGFQFKAMNYDELT